MKKKLDYILKHNKILLIVFTKTLSMIFRFVGLFIRTEENLILISANSRGYNDSPRAIYEYMKKDPKYAQYRFVWAVDDVTQTIEGAELVKADTWQYFKTALKAQYWITSVNIERGLHFKKKKTVFLNTWHGVAINEMGNAVAGRTDFDWSDTDYICYSAENERPIYYRDFNARPESMIPTGLPRNDELYHVDPNKVIEIKKNLNIPEDKKVILYAPTWRDSEDFGKSYQIKPPIDCDVWKKALSDEYVVILRTHPYTNELMGVTFDDFFFDGTMYPRVNDLMMISDMLISDYSSIIFDYCVLERPVICFGYDYEAYAEKRGFYIDLETVIPSGIIRDETHLIEHIKSMDYEEQVAKTKVMKENHVTYGGNATEQIVNAVFG
ncbi:CDP-glycerol glycerophosphotransferase family protein [Erysipelothrix rhusiopathiae]|uniref:CDP-glycerol glycerophosphotransferase family protein n=1 Tax=Erysipelothrix rhusiopathiae TaxID=1648 RepID=UPI000F458B79|nr:CDP-glycerol glycerophosphotransferase family protein [Erysipelothrix rhusiopathiae]MDE8340487.1 CDP-glycerol glycerophosphotransferase family protein [Erysipelothrix rhusiopathiae]MDE8342146.1 CDP-glycerol glycerophosphotransferase family protein [Erysipelothrix rhusiopathiae]MDV7679521.1 CDP-glycerol glycerophosphotransferase family protein [Erysipelothrix rhusiopathiae]RNM25851.1 CDP-glycerol--glycerophosphate glycerophosphotransferase [Erysipelothrix rhusiopathiae]URQ77709.1 CDP-glycero